MKISSQVIDSKNGYGVQGVSVLAYELDGRPIVGVGTTTNKDGEFTLDDPRIDDNVMIEFTHVNYETVDLTPDFIGISVNFVPKKNALSNVVVSAVAKAKKLDKRIWYIAGASILISSVVAYLVTRKK